MPAPEEGRPRRRKVTLTEVAERAEVSLATASRALAGTYPVAQATKTAVLRAAHELGYRREKVSTSPHTVAVVARDIRQDFLIETVAGIEEVAQDSGRFCLIASTGGDHETEMAALDSLSIDPRVSGVVVAGGSMDSPTIRRDMAAMIERYAAKGLPLVLCGRPDVSRDSQALVVDYDRVSGAASAVSLLLSQGHTRIACIRGPEGFTTSDERAMGYETAMATFGEPVDRSMIRIGPRERATGFQGTLSLLEEHPDITAIFAENDDIAIGCLAAAREAGLTLPDDLSVVGFDDLAMAADSWPRLTTVHLPFDQMGRAAARLVLDPPAPGSGRTKVMVGTHLVMRDSVKSNWKAPASEPSA